MNKTNIPWADLTWNPITGCTKGCDYCYARGIARRFSESTPEQIAESEDDFAKFAECFSAEKDNPEMGSVFPFGFLPTIYPHRLDEPLSAKKPSRIYLGSMGDIFDPAFPDDFRDRIFATVATTPQHTYLLLTKQPEEMRRYMVERQSHHTTPPPWPRHGDETAHRLPNLWLGVTVTNQADADERIPLLLDTPAAHRWVSVEPMLGPVDLSRWINPTGLSACAHCDNDEKHYLSSRYVQEMEPQDDGFMCPECGETRLLTGWDNGLDWVVVGGQTPGKPLHEQGCTDEECADCPDYDNDCGLIAVRSLRDQCAEAGTPVFYKHGGAVPELDGVKHDAIGGAL